MDMGRGETAIVAWRGLVLLMTCPYPREQHPKTPCGAKPRNHDPVCWFLLWVMDHTGTVTFKGCREIEQIRRKLLKEKNKKVLKVVADVIELLALSNSVSLKCIFR